MLPQQVADQASRTARKAVDTTAVRRLLAEKGIRTESCQRALKRVAAVIESELGLTARPCQYEAAACLLNQQLAEMDTGEGKSVAIAMAAAVAALTGAPVHVMTTNDYLAQRDAHYFRPVFEELGLTVSSIPAGQSPAEERAALYRADICYGTAKTLAFDYLRDQRLIAANPYSVDAPPQTLMRGLCMAIVDEADSILLDEATMPLVLAQTVNDPLVRARLWQALDLARQLNEGADFVLNRQTSRVALTQAGLERISILAENYSDEWLNSRYRRELTTDALTALWLYQRDTDYIVRDDQIVVVDANTGRAVDGRQFPGQLHALIAIHQNLPPPAPTQQASGLTYPRFFARYHHLCGLSGTLTESSRELSRLYGLSTYRVERHQRSQAIHLPLRVFDSRKRQFKAATLRAMELASHGRPVLIGTDSVHESNLLADSFSRNKQPVTVLNASNDANEAELIERAGISGQITISTQIAGRGTDIEPSPQALASGGLHVLSLQHNRSTRIDRQMIGRAARQGNPGSAEQWIRVADSPLAADRLPDPLARISHWLIRLGTPRTALWLIRSYWKLEDRTTRSARLQADREWSERLHFSSMSNQ